MKQFFAALSLLVWSITTTAQSSTRVIGTVKDASGLGLLATNISILMAADSSLVKADIADNDGHFEIALPMSGTYLLRYSLLGYQTKYAGPFAIADGAAYTAPPAILAPTASELKAVTVSGKKPLIEVKADKVVFNVENSINATGSNAMELLRKSPGITVDNNDNISMKGKTGVKIYVDGKMTQLDTKDLAAYLQGINSNDVEAIEMISNPSAKYDASGNAGVINIRLKKNKKYGTNGSVNATLIQGVTPKANGSVNLNYRNQKVNLFGNLSTDQGIQRNTLSFDRLQNDTNYIQRNVSYTDQHTLNMKAGADWFMNSRSTLGLMVTTSGAANSWKSEGNTNIYNLNNDFIKKLAATNYVPENRINNNVNLNYKYSDTSGRELNFDADYGLFRRRANSTQPNNYVDLNNNPLYSVINKNNTPTDINIFTVKVDYEQKLGAGKLGVGAKTSYVVTDNTFDFFNVVNKETIKVLERSNSFKYTENVNAAYANYNRPLGKKWSLQAGLRMENTASKGELTRADGRQQGDDTVTRNYTDLFPSAALTWNLNKKHSLNLTYSRRIDRPTYQDLNPFEIKLDELAYEKGNAFLRPQYTNTAELTHTFMGFINTTAGYSYVHDYATQVTDTLRNANYVQQRNLATQQILSFSLGAPLPLAKWWMGYVNLWYNYQMFEGKIGTNKVNIDIPSYGAYMQHTLKLKNNYSAEISGWYNGPSVWGATWRTRPQGAIDIGAQKQFWNNNATVKLSITDIFFTAPWKASNYFGGMNLTGSGTWESRTVRVSFSYRFGSNQISSARDRKTGIENESSRIKGK